MTGRTSRRAAQIRVVKFPPGRADPSFMRYNRQRAFYRVQYPTQERPTFLLGLEEVPVLDVSEYGIRFGIHDGLELEPGQEIEGLSRFRERATHKVKGEVVWIRNRAAAMKLQVPVPFGIILDEQRYLRSRYKLLD